VIDQVQAEKPMMGFMVNLAYVTWLDDIHLPDKEGMQEEAPVAEPPVQMPQVPTSQAYPPTGWSSYQMPIPMPHAPWWHF
jgi:hypothetical protein